MKKSVKELIFAINDLEDINEDILEEKFEEIYNFYQSGKNYDLPNLTDKDFYRKANYSGFLVHNFYNYILVSLLANLLEKPLCQKTLEKSTLYISKINSNLDAQIKYFSKIGNFTESHNTFSFLKKLDKDSMEYLRNHPEITSISAGMLHYLVVAEKKDEYGVNDEELLKLKVYGEECEKLPED